MLRVVLDEVAVDFRTKGIVSVTPSAVVFLVCIITLSARAEGQTSAMASDERLPRKCRPLYLHTTFTQPDYCVIW